MQDLLTAQFYDFELRGRGIFLFERPVELEAPFLPFRGFRHPRPYVDDGQSHTALSAIASLFRPRQKPPDVVPYESPPLEPFAYVDTDFLSGCRVGFARAARPTSDSMERLLSMLSGIREPVSFEIVADSDFIAVQLAYRLRYGAFLQSQLLAHFPDAILVPLSGDDLQGLLDPDRPFLAADFGLGEECMRPIAAPRGSNDALTGLMGLCDHLRDGERVVLQVLFNGTANDWAESVERSVSDGANGSFFADAPEMPALAREKCSRILCAATVRVAAQTESHADARTLLRQAAYAVTMATSSPFNALVALPEEPYAMELRFEDMTLRQSRRLGMLLNVGELATLAHFPGGSLSRKLQRSRHNTKAVPAALVDAPLALGVNEYHGVSRRVGISEEQRYRHTHVIGGTGSGKSTLLLNLIMQDVDGGRGLCAVDPHGDLIDAILANIPEHRVKDVVVIDPSDTEFPVGLNVLSAHSDLERELLASDLVALFRRFSTSWGDQMNSVLANAICAFLYNSRTGTLADMRRFLIEQPFRNAILSTCTDPDIAYYWQKEYPMLKTSSIGSILTRLDAFLRPRSIRSMVCQPLGLDFGVLMDTKKILLVKLSHGLIGEENSHLLGSFIVSKIQQTAMARQAQEAKDRVGFHCYVDEFQHYVTPSMGSILTGGRKYRLSLTLAHQSMQPVEAIDRSIASSLLSNAGVRICFRVSEDARRMQEGFSSFGADDLQNLPVGEAIVRVNTPEQDFNIRVIPLETAPISLASEIISHSRQAYGARAEKSTAGPTTASQPEPLEPSTPTAATVPTEPKVLALEREHLRLQRLVKKLAQEHGYVAHEEVATPDGTGLIDVVIEKGGKAMAVEISVSTNAAWEMHNIEKCVAAGYQDIVACASTQAKVAQLRKLLTTLPIEVQTYVRVISPEQIPELFVVPPAPEESEKTYKGYRIKVNHSGSEDTSKSEIIRRILNGGKK